MESGRVHVPAAHRRAGVRGPLACVRRLARELIQIDPIRVSMR